MLRTCTPEREARRVRRLLQVAGYPAGWTMTRVLAAKPALVAVVGSLVAVRAAGPRGPAVVLGLRRGHGRRLLGARRRCCDGRGEERQAQLARELPDVLDQMTIAVEAGLGFEAALTWVADNGKGALAEEFRRTLADVNVGRPRRQAYEALVARTRVEDLRRFVAAINQADTYGIAVADVLRVQAQRDAAQAPPAGRGEGDEGAGQGVLPADAVHPAGTAHGRGGAGGPAAQRRAGLTALGSGA